MRGSIGVATGRVFCGLVGNDRRREYTFLGNTVNLAARLMILARDGTESEGKELFSILCDRPTFDAARERAEFEVLPAQPVKGRDDLVEMFRPLREQREVIRRQTDLVGRSAEKAILINAIQELQRGAPLQVVVLHGEAGIGKSRLMEELLQQAQVSQLKSFSGAGDPMEKSNPYFAWRSIFGRALGFEEAAAKLQLSSFDRQAILDAASGKLEAIEAGLSRYLPLLNVILPVSVPENESTATMTSEVRGGNIRDLLVRLLQREVEQSPILVSVEDLHWLDSASWTLLSDVVQNVRPLLLAVSTLSAVPAGAFAVPGAGWAARDHLHAAGCDVPR